VFWNNQFWWVIFMKKLFVFFVIGILLFGLCSAQNAYAQSSSNDVQRIIGTWSIEGGGITFTFNADGSFTASGRHLFHNLVGNYMVNNSRLIFRNSGARNASVRDFYISADGRILVFQHTVRQQFPDGFLHSTNSVLIYLWLIRQ